MSRDASVIALAPIAGECPVALHRETMDFASLSAAALSFSFGSGSRPLGTGLLDLLLALSFLESAGALSEIG